MKVFIEELSARVTGSATDIILFYVTWQTTIWPTWLTEPTLDTGRLELLTVVSNIRNSGEVELSLHDKRMRDALYSTISQMQHTNKLLATNVIYPE